MLPHVLPPSSPLYIFFFNSPLFALLFCIMKNTSYFSCLFILVPFSSAPHGLLTIISTTCAHVGSQESLEKRL